MKVYRYNSKRREDRKYNNCEKEKNPNAIKFYAKSLDYAEKYRYIYTEDGEILYECELEIIELEHINLFNMSEQFATLNVYRKYINNSISVALKDYTLFMNNATSQKKRKFWEKQIQNLFSERENELQRILKNSEFQGLSDFELQNQLVAELTEKGFDGYITNNEIAVF